MLSRPALNRAMFEPIGGGARFWGEMTISPLEQQAADALRRARKLPVGPDRNDLRQLAVGLLWLHRNGMDALLKDRLQSDFPINRGNLG
jgi:hypothetical protein